MRKHVFFAASLAAFMCGCGAPTTDDVEIEAGTLKVASVEELPSDTIVTSTHPDTLSYKVYSIKDYGSKLSVFATLEDEYSSKKDLWNTIHKIYYQFYPYQGKVPTDLTVTITTSEHPDDASFPDDWIAMLVKSENKSQRVTYRDPKMNPEIKVNDRKKSPKEELISNLAEKNIDLCELYKRIGVMERQNGIAADRKYPYDAVQRSMYQESLNEYGRSLLQEKYDIDEITLVNVNYYGIDECE